MNATKVLLLGLPSLLMTPTLKAQTYSLPDTGQTNSYTTSFGEDSDYTGNSPDLTDNSDGTITDNVTGLMWQQVDGGEMTWEDAVAYAATLSLGDHSDWRLPTSHEMLNLLNHGLHPSLDQTYFQYDNNDFWWGAIPYVGDPAKIWVANAGGGVGPHNKNEAVSAGGLKIIHPRCVRGTTVASSFTENGDGTVTDSRTDLMFAQSAFADLAWDDAIVFAEASTYAGYDDWRLPNVKELRSIADDGYTGPSVDVTFFSFVSSDFYWSSTTEINNGLGWVASFDDGRVGYEAKTLEYGVMLVRDASSTGTIVSFCDPATNNSTGAPAVLAGTWGSGVGSGLHLEITGGVPGEFGYLIAGNEVTSGIQISNGLFCLAGTSTAQFFRYYVAGTDMSAAGSFDASGIFVNTVGTSSTGYGFDVPSTIPATIPITILSGDTWHFQGWFRDTPTGSGSSNFTNGLSATF
ncbi:MAG: DUF1566 domain-containing protein [bacterium]|nr:DUF1566 domain-containing protein [bacterium]